jgi:hypothetical protein
MPDTVRHGIAVMREFHSVDGLDDGTRQMLESLGDAATATLEAKQQWTPHDKRTLIMVLLRSACQIGRQGVLVVG